MPFKPPRFHSDRPFDQAPPTGDAALEAQLADDLATVGGIDAVDVTVTVAGRRIVLAGRVGSHAERARLAAVIRARLPQSDLAIDDRVRVEAGHG